MFQLKIQRNNLQSTITNDSGKKKLQLQHLTQQNYLFFDTCMVGVSVASITGIFRFCILFPLLLPLLPLLPL